MNSPSNRSKSRSMPENLNMPKELRRLKGKALARRLKEARQSLVATALHTAGVCEDAGALEGALTSYDTVLAVDASHALAHLGRGAILMQQGDWAESVAAFEAASRLDPADALPHVYLGQVFDRTGQAEAAARAWAAADRRDPVMARISRAMITTSARWKETGSEEDVAAWDQLAEEAASHMRGR